MTNRARIGTMFGAVDNASFMGIPSTTIENLNFTSVVFGAPCATPYESVGAYCAQAPDAIRAAVGGFTSNLTHFDFDLGGPMFPFGVDAADLGNLPYDESDAPGNRELIRSTTSAILKAGGVPVVIGGDDSIPIPMLQAFEGHSDVTVVQIDAHIDWRDEVRGEVWGLSSTMRRASEMSHVKNIIQVGQRGIGSARAADHQAALDWGVQFVSARDVHARGIQQAIDLVPAGAQVVIALDCDALDPSIVPGVIGRSPGGLTYWHVVELLHGIAQKSSIAAFDLVEFMPEADVDAIGALNNARIICNVLGLVTRQAQSR
ncbi:MAG: arginase family protein [Actinomycetes bacterium]